MNSLIYLKEADELRLKMLLERQSPPPYPDAAMQKTLEELLRRAERMPEVSGTGPRAGLYGSVTLVSPTDSRDYFKFTIVMPHEADVDNDRISVFMPVSLAVLGRGCGETVTWQTRVGERRMRIIALDEGTGGENPPVPDAAAAGQPA